MNVVVNGKPRTVEEGMTVSDLVHELGLGDRNVVVERNGEALERASFSAVRIGPEDVIEIVRPVQGGAIGNLYLVAPGEFPVDALRSVIDAGVDIVQLRMKEAEVSEILEIGDQMLRVCREAGIPFIVNDRPDIALALDADGVHLGQDDLPPNVARAILGPGKIIGRSTHSTDDIARAISENEEGVADYIAVGPINETPTKPGRPRTGIELIHHASKSVRFPWFGIGGIDPTNIRKVKEAGASRVVVVRAIAEAADPVEAARQLKRALE